MATDWFLYNEANVLAILKVVKAAGRSIHVKSLAQAAGFDRFELSRILKGSSGYQRISESAYRKLVALLSNYRGKNYLTDTPDIVSTDVTAMGFAHFFKLTKEDVQDAIENFCGVYTSYRYSFRLKDRRMILRGLTEFYANDDRTAVLTREIYRIQKATGVSDSEMFFERNGCLIADKAKTLPKILCHKTDGSMDLEVAYFDEVLPRGHEPHPQQIRTMRGLVVDWQRKSPYATPIALVRESDTKISVKNGKYKENFLAAFVVSDSEVSSIVPDLIRSFRVLDQPMVEL